MASKQAGAALAGLDQEGSGEEEEEEEYASGTVSPSSRVCCNGLCVQCASGFSWGCHLLAPPSTPPPTPPLLLLLPGWRR